MKHKITLSQVLPWAVMGLALGFRLWLLRFRYAAAFDEINYLKLAAGAAQSGPGAAFHTFWPPLWPWVVSLAGRMVGDFELAGRLLSILLGVALLPLLYGLVRRWVGQTEALIAVVLAGFSPAFTFYQTGVLTEPLYTLLTLSGVMLGWRALKQRRWWLHGLVSLLFGLGYLCRPEGIGYVLVYWGILLLKTIIHTVKNRRFIGQSWIPLAMVPLAFLLTAGPYLIFLHSATGPLDPERQDGQPARRGLRPDPGGRRRGCLPVAFRGQPKHVAGQTLPRGRLRGANREGGYSQGAAVRVLHGQEIYH